MAENVLQKKLRLEREAAGSLGTKDPTLTSDRTPIVSKDNPELASQLYGVGSGAPTSGVVSGQAKLAKDQFIEGVKEVRKDPRYAEAIKGKGLSADAGEQFSKNILYNNPDIVAPGVDFGTEGNTRGGEFIDPVTGLKKSGTLGGADGASFRGGKRVDESGVSIPKYDPPKSNPNASVEQNRVVKANYEASYARKVAQEYQKQTASIQKGVGGEQEFALGRDAERDNKGRVEKTQVNPEYANLSEIQKKINLQNKQAGKKFIEEKISVESGRAPITGQPDRQVTERFNQAVNMLESSDANVQAQGQAMFDTLPQGTRDNYTNWKAKQDAPEGVQAAAIQKEERLIRDSLGMSDTDELSFDETGKPLINGKTESESAIARATERSDTARMETLTEMNKNHTNRMARISSAYTTDGKLSKQGSRALAQAQREYTTKVTQTNRSYDQGLGDYVRQETARDAKVQLKNEQAESPVAQINRIKAQERADGAFDLQKAYEAKGIQKSFTAAVNEWDARQRFSDASPTYKDKAQEIDEEFASPQFNPDTMFATATSKFGGNTAEAQKYMNSRGFLESDIETQLEEYQKSTLGYSDEEINGFAKPMSKARKLQDSLVTQTDPLSAAIMLGSYKNTLDSLDETPDKQIVRAGLQGIIARTQNEVLRGMAQDMMDDISGDIDQFGKAEFLAGQGTPEQRQSFLTGTSQLAAAGRAPTGTGTANRKFKSISKVGNKSYKVFSDGSLEEIEQGAGSGTQRINEDGLLIDALDPPKAPTMGERSALTFYDRMNNAEANLLDLEDDIVSRGAFGQAAIGFNPLLQSEESQRIAQAQREFTEARLRKDSGAAIPPSEFANDKKTYFPQPGDLEGALAQKRDSRKVALEALRGASANAYIDKYGENPNEFKIRKRNEAAVKEIEVTEKSSGRTGTIPANEFDPALYTKSK